LPEGNELCTVLLFYLGKSISYFTQGLLPGDTLPSIFSPLTHSTQGVFQSIRMVEELWCGLPFWTNISPAGRAVRIPGNFDHTALLQMDKNLADAVTTSTGSTYLF
jgi:hypothetical protein